MQKKYILLSLIAATLASLFLFSNHRASADNPTISSVSVTVPVACTLSGTNTEHTASVTPGTYTTDIGTTTLKASCNDNNGFSIYAIGYTGGEYGVTNLIGTSTNLTIPTAIHNINDTTSNWSMKLTSTSGTYTPIIAGSIADPERESGDPDYSNYAAVPATYERVAYRNSATDVGVSALGSTLTTTYSAFISATQSADTYQGKVKYTMVHPASANSPLIPLANSDCPANSICYAPNAGDVDGSMSSLGTISTSPTASKQVYIDASEYIQIADSATATLVAPNYSRSGYGFAGWSPDFTATETSIIYGPNETITTGDLSTSGLILYPVWIASAGNIQNWTGCTELTQTSYNNETGVLSASLSSVTALKDLRDNNVYAIARLTDGNCWMIENLRLAAENSTNSSLAQGFGDDTSNGRGKFIGLANSEDAGFANNATANSLYYSGTQSGTATIDIGTTSYPAYRVPRYNNSNTNRSLSASYRGDESGIYYQWFGYGNYYNWAAAIASTTYYNNNASDSAGTSLCPAGWQLPYGGSAGNGASPKGFYYLGASMGATDYSSSATSMKWRRFPNNFVRAGFFDATLARFRGMSGSYWSSTANGIASSLILNMFYSPDETDPGRVSEAKYHGISVRCVANNN